MPACLKYRKKTGREGGGGGGKKNSEKRVLSYLNVKRHASRGLDLRELYRVQKGHNIRGGRIF